MSAINRDVRGVPSGGQAGGTVLVNQGSTITVNGDVVLPPDNGLDMLEVYNVSGSAINIFPDSGSGINALAQNAAFSLADKSFAICRRVLANRWGVK